MKKLMALCLLTLVTPLSVSAELIDKIAAVVNDQVVTFSDLKRIQSNSKARRQVAPLIYEKEKLSSNEVIETIIKGYMIRNKLSELGISIDDEAVENRIVQIEKSQGVSRDFLVSYLNSQNLSFKEYFELIKQMMEVSYFNSKIISPLVSVSDFEVKNYYDKVSKDSNSYLYQVVDYAFDPKLRNVHKDDDIIKILSKLRSNGTLPNDFQGLETNELELEGSALTKDVSDTLRKTKSNNFSSVVEIGGVSHVFYIKGRKVLSTNNFEKSKNALTQRLIVNKSKEAIKKWISSERENYYIKKFL